MSKQTSRLLATSLSQTVRVQGSVGLPIRSFSQTCCRRADDDIQQTTPTSRRPSDQASPQAPPQPPRKSPAAPRRSLLDSLNSRNPSTTSSPSSSFGLRDLGASLSPSGTPRSRQQTEQLAQDTLLRARNQPTSTDILSPDQPQKWGDEPFHFHIYGHKHNTHITVTKPDRNAIISISAGQIGFRKAKRATYDAAYQLCAYVMDKLNQGGWHREIHKMEVVLRGFGHGREAATKVLLGNEGKLYRGKIVMVSDATRLKFGGTRSAKPRRLG
ncbi:hypothetical protein BJ170DRAFT_582971 [Xylariales sp. AK1849]|nr:hypothetical protein BJ170DRAFT_582971 [Xylariales sp. AK1849]